MSVLNAAGICRRRGTPSFWRRTSQCAFAVRGEMPSRSPDLLVRAAERDQLDDLELALGQREVRVVGGASHGANATPRRAGATIGRWEYSRGLDPRRRGSRRARSSPRARARSPRRAPPASARRSAAAGRARRAGASRIISGPSVAIVKRTPRSTNVRKTSRTAASSGERLRQQVRRRADLEHDLGVAQLAHQLLVAGGEDAVADPVGPQHLEHLADLRRGPSRRPPRRRGSSRRAPPSRAVSTIGCTCR